MDLKLDIGGVSAEIDLEDAAERLLQISVTDPLNAGLNAGINAGINAGLNKLNSSKKKGDGKAKDKTNDVYTEEDEVKYQKKKMLALGMMDLALLSANSNQLRHILESPKHPFYLTRLAFISTSIFFQVMVLVFILINTNYSIPKKGEPKHKCADVLNICITGGVLVISAINGYI